MVTVESKLEFGNKEQIRVIAEMNKPHWTYWCVRVTDNFGYETPLYTGYAFKYEEDVIEWAKTEASRWSTLFEDFKYEASRIKRDCDLDGWLNEHDFAEFVDYLEYCAENNLEWDKDFIQDEDE